MKATHAAAATIASMAVVMTIAMPSAALAKHRLHHIRFAKARLHVRAAVENRFQPVTALPPMRYYGGPKSPMWRG